MTGSAQLIQAVAGLVHAVAWPVVVLFALHMLGPSLKDFLLSLTEVRLKGAGFEAAATVRRFRLDASGQRLHDFWKPSGKIDRSNEARIKACMKQSGIRGSVPWLITSGSAEDRERVAACLALDE